MSSNSSASGMSPSDTKSSSYSSAIAAVYFLGCLMVISSMLLHPVTSNAQSASTRLGFYLYMGGHSLTQNNVQNVLSVNGYRSVDTADQLPDSSSTIKDYSAVSVRSPYFLVGSSYRWSSRMQLSLLISLPIKSSDYYVNVGSVFPSRDNLYLQTSYWQSDLSFDYFLLPYPRKKKSGFELLASGGLSNCSFTESLAFRLVDTSQSVNDPPLVSSFNSRRYGVSALFRFEAVYRINQQLSLIPARLTWVLPVLRPGFKAETVDNGATKRSVSGRNYDLGGWFLYFGGAVNF